MDCIYCQHGNIFVRNKAILIVKDAVLKMIQPSFQEYIIHIYARASMENAHLTSNYSFGMDVSGKADFTNCEMKDDSRLFSVENGEISVKKSKFRTPDIGEKNVDNSQLWRVIFFRAEKGLIF